MEFFRNLVRLTFYRAWRFLFNTLPYFVLSRFKMAWAAWTTLIFFKLKYGPMVSKSLILAFMPDGSKLYCQSRYRSVIQEIYYFPAYDRFFEPKDGSIIVDVGAHVGVYTIKAARRAGRRGLVVSIEPHPHNYKLLLQNVKMNNLDQKVITINAALGNFEEKARLYLSSHPGGHSLLSDISLSTGKWVEVPVKTLDGVMQTLGLRHCDLIKIDVEGCELEVLEGAEYVLKRTSMVVVAAYHMAEEANVIKDFLTIRGFRTLIADSFVYAQKVDDSPIRIENTNGPLREERVGYPSREISE